MSMQTRMARGGPADPPAGRGPGSGIRSSLVSRGQPGLDQALDIFAECPVAVDRTDDSGEPVQQRSASWRRRASGQRGCLVAGQQLAGGDRVSVAQRNGELLGSLPVRFSTVPNALTLLVPNR